MPVDLIVVTKDRPDLLEQLEAALAQQDTEMCVLVWDNGYNDVATVNLCERFGWHRFTRGRNLSFSESCNRAVRYGASNKQLILINNDAVPERGAIDALLECVRPEPIIGTLNVHADGTVNHAGVSFSGMQPVHVGRGESIRRWEIEPCRQWPSTTFACVRIDRWLWDELDGLDEAYWYSAEDTDFCMRAAERGYGVAVCNKAVVRHEEFGTRKPGEDAVSQAVFQAQWIFTGRAADALEQVKPRPDVPEEEGATERRVEQ